MNEPGFGRTPDQALVYLRRSTSKQESGIHTQLSWALQEAAKHSVKIDACSADVDYMLSKELYRHNAVFLDDGITGADLGRPGLTALTQEATKNRRISHVFIHLADRLARPERPEDGVAMENSLRSLGVTVVFQNRTLKPLRRGERDVAQSITSLLEYNSSGEFLERLAIRVIECQKSLAKKGHWTGGRPPYGFVRVRVDPDGTETPMSDGTSIKRPGSHTELRIGDPEKIRIRLMIFAFCREKGWGTKRISNELNRLRIPSPDVGRFRKEKNGHVHVVSGRWTPSTVRAILNDRIAIGLLDYGLQSEGRHRRAGADGPRYLEDTDYGPDGTTIIRKNPSNVVVTAALRGVEPLMNLQDFEECQQILTKRGKNQRGIPRCKDPSKYPLSTRVFDLSCSHPMYGRTSGSRPMYTCSLYINTDGQACEHNQFDAEALLAYILRFLKQRIHMAGGRNALERQLRKIARTMGPQRDDDGLAELQLLEKQLAAAEQELKLGTQNLFRAEDEEERMALRKIFQQKRLETDALRHQIEPLRRRLDAVAHGRDEDHEVADALALFDRIERLAGDPQCRPEIRRMLQELNLNVWLRFREGHKGKRAVRILQSGMITTGLGPLPVVPYGGKNRFVNGEMCSDDALSSERVSEKRPLAAETSPREGSSFRKGNRGDRR